MNHSTLLREETLEITDLGANPVAFTLPVGTELNLLRPLGKGKVERSGFIILTSRQVTVWTDGSVTITEIDARFGAVKVEMTADDGSRNYVETLPPKPHTYAAHPWRSERSVRATRT